MNTTTRGRRLPLSLSKVLNFGRVMTSHALDKPPTVWFRESPPVYLLHLKDVQTRNTLQEELFAPNETGSDEESVEQTRDRWTQIVLLTSSYMHNVMQANRQPGHVTYLWLGNWAKLAATGCPLQHPHIVKQKQCTWYIHNITRSNSVGSESWLL